MSFNSWKEVSLEEITDVLGDGLHGTPNYDDRGEHFFINGNNLAGKIVIDDKTKKVSEEEYLRHKKPLSDRTIFVSINGTLGNVAVYNGENVMLGKSACYFNVNNKYCKEFVKYVMLSEGFKNYLSSHSTGTTIKNMGLKQMRNFHFMIPVHSEQKAIANILYTIDNKIENNNQINKTLENMAQAIFTNWFVDFEFPQVDGEPYKSSGGQMVESELGMIPKGWEVKKLEDISTIVMGQSPKGTSYNEDGEGEVFYQGRTDFTERFPIRRLFTTEPKRMANEGDILMSVRAPVGDLNIANERCCIGRGLSAISSSANLGSYILYVMHDLRDRLNVYNGEGTVFGSINQKDLKALKVISSDDGKVERQFNNYIEPVDKLIRNNEDETRKLIKLRDTLLPKLMSGEIRVPIEE